MQRTGAGIGGVRVDGAPQRSRKRLGPGVLGVDVADDAGPAQAGAHPDEEKEQLRKLARVIKVKEVQKVKFQDYGQNVQAILINPKWKPFDPETQNSQDQDLSEEEQSANEERKSKEQVSDSDSEDEHSRPPKKKSKAFQGITMKEFRQLNFSAKLMSDGILFVWVEKEYIFDVCKFLEDQKFYYVENMVWVMLDKNMKKGMIEVWNNCVRGGED